MFALGANDAVDFRYIEQLFLTANPTLLWLIARRMGERANMVKHLSEIAAIDPPATRASNKMLGFVRRLFADAPANDFSAWNVVHRSSCP